MWALTGLERSSCRSQEIMNLWETFRSRRNAELEDGQSGNAIPETRITAKKNGIVKDDKEGEQKSRRRDSHLQLEVLLDASA